MEEAVSEEKNGVRVFRADTGPEIDFRETREG